MSDNNEIDYGPLAALIGSWQGDKGMDVAPEADGPEQNPYYETIIFEAIGDVDNANSQVIAALRYHQVVYRQSNDQVFHNQTGYWMWDAERKLVMQSLTIPRGVCVLAGGTAETSDNQIEIKVQASNKDPDWGIVQSPFMQKNALTTAFEHTMQVIGDKLIYSETTSLDIYGSEFAHTDKNQLTRCP